MREEMAALEERRSLVQASGTDVPPSRPVDYSTDGTGYAEGPGFGFREISEPAPLPRREPRVLGA